MRIADLETPCLLLDRARVDRNIARLADRARELGVTWRPHLKTPKSLDVACLAAPGADAPVTVSTLAEAEYFAAGGYRDILWAAAPTPAKLVRADRIRRSHNTRLLCVIDSVELTRAAAERASELDCDFEFLIEIDCGEHRSGVRPASDALRAIADAIAAAPGLTLSGVMTHAGHSYAHADVEGIGRVAEQERDAAVASATMLREAGHACDIVSVGSSPTLLYAPHLEGVTEARAGVGIFWDLDQHSRGVCERDDIAAGVLASVIGHNREAQRLIIDAGSLALSKDLGANKHMPEVKYGLLCHPLTREPYEGLAVEAAYQEHGIVPVSDPAWFDRLPIGEQLLVLPNHICLTAAAYDGYFVVEGDAVIATWSRVNGW